MKAALDSPGVVTLAELLAARYGGHVPAGPVLDNATVRALVGHRSVRRYLPEPLPPGALETIVAAAQSAATSSNLQVWSVLSVEDSAKRARLAALSGGQRHVEAAPVFLVWLADLARAERASSRAAGGREAFDYVESFIVSVVDATLAAQSAVAALESMGLGSVYVGGLRNHPEEVARELELPPLVMPLFGLCIGRPDPARPGVVKPRPPQAAILHHDRYDAERADLALAPYDSTLAEFQASQGLPATGWSKLVANRLGKVSGLNGRERLRAALTSFGFRLS